MRYLYLLIGNIVALTVAGRFGLDFLAVGVFVFDFWLWRHWLQKSQKDR